MAEIGELAGGDVQVFGFQHFDERLVPPVHERRGALGRDAGREQDPGFLEALADRGDVVGEAARRELQALVCLRFGQADDPAQQLAVVVVRIERAAREHVGAAEERGALRALEHEYFVLFPQENQRRCGPRLHRHQVVRAARSFSFVALIIARMRSQSASLILSSAR